MESLQRSNCASLTVVACPEAPEFVAEGIRGMTLRCAAECSLVPLLQDALGTLAAEWTVAM